MPDSISDFVDKLAKSSVPARLYNQYGHGVASNLIRRANLRRYLMQLKAYHPDVALVGEAAGHRGCRLTGVPFTSERLLLEGNDEHNLLGADSGYRCTGERGRIVGEQSATIVWGVVAQMSRPPLLWNALPFHPHQDGKPWSNRTPSRAELALGIPHLIAILELFAVTSVVAVGNKAAHILTDIAIPFRKVRHPAYGGKRAFVDGLLGLVS
jgi:uracil-DNA glycosylase